MGFKRTYKYQISTFKFISQVSFTSFDVTPNTHFLSIHIHYYIVNPLAPELFFFKF